MIWFPNRQLITGEQVKTAVLAADIIRVDHHDCGLCGEFTHYSVMSDQLYYSSACGCGWAAPRPVPWSAAADWINMQTSDDVRAELMKRFGFPTVDTPPPGPVTSQTVVVNQPVHVCPIRDIECGSNSASWCDSCPKRQPGK